MHIPDDRLYSFEHYWIKTAESPKIGLLGVSDFVQVQMGDLIFVKLPPHGHVIKLGDIFADVEGSKAILDLPSIFQGEIIEVNTKLEEKPDIINESPYEDGWICRIRFEQSISSYRFISAEQYKEFIATCDLKQKIRKRKF